MELNCRFPKIICFFKKAAERKKQPVRCVWAMPGWSAQGSTCRVPLPLVYGTEFQLHFSPSLTVHQVCVSPFRRNSMTVHPTSTV